MYLRQSSGLNTVHPTTVKLNNSEAIFFLLLMAIKLSTR